MLHLGEGHSELALLCVPGELGEPLIPRLILDFARLGSTVPRNLCPVMCAIP